MDTSRFKKWKHFTITESLPGSAWGTGGTGLGDFTGNGIMDVAVSRRETRTAYWFERKNDDLWIRHDIGQSEHLTSTLGAAVLDIDHDGWLDIAFTRVWLKNPGNLADNPDTPWEVREYDGGGHDLVAADINGDGKTDLVTYDGNVLAWFDTASAMKKNVLIVS